jgi:surface protein
MFERTAAFNEDISAWNVASVTDIVGWCISKVLESRVEKLESA